MKCLFCKEVITNPKPKQKLHDECREDHYKQHRKEWYQKNKDKIKLRKTNKKLAREPKICRECDEPILDEGYGRVTHERCRKDYIKKKQAVAHQKRDKAKLRKKFRTFYRNNIPKMLLKNARLRAAEINVEFSLTEEDIVVPDTCPVLGKKLEVGTPYGPSLDRIDPSKGYTKENVQVLSRKANVMKNNATNEELKEFANWVLTTVK